MPKLIRILPVWLGLVAWISTVQHFPFFWDTVQLAGKHAHFFFENGLHWAPLPADIDSGHPPVFGFLLAYCWTVFGKTLPVSHWCMLPFLLGITWFAFRSGDRQGGNRLNLLLAGLVLLDPVMAGQSALVSPDIVLACCFLAAIVAILDQKIWLLGLAVWGLCAISMRGMMTAAALSVWCLLLARRKEWNLPPPRYFMAAFLPGAAFALWFLVWHQTQTGWTGYHPDSPWAQAFAPASGREIGRNALVIAWRWTDFGRIFELAAIGLLLFRQKPPVRTPNESPPISLPGLFALVGCLVVFLSPSALLYHNLSAHRYFLPLFLGIHLLFTGLSANSTLPTRPKLLLHAIVVLGLASGNCWIYPRGISMDWDSTLAHLPYHGLRKEFVRYLDEHSIDFQSVGTAFPNINSGEMLALDGDVRVFAAKDYEHNTYMLTSNVFNDFDERDYRILSENWTLIKREKRGGVWMELYQRKR